MMCDSKSKQHSKRGVGGANGPLLFLAKFGIVSRVACTHAANVPICAFSGSFLSRSNKQLAVPRPTNVARV